MIMHWNTHTYHDEYSTDHFDHYKIPYVPDQPAPDQDEEVGDWDAVVITFVLASVIALIFVFIGSLLIFWVLIR
jgi:hypothetical protein